MENTEIKAWKDPRHPDLQKYWQNIIDQRKQDCLQGKNYVADWFRMMVGPEFIRFVKSYNKRMKLDIDAVPGLSDWLFEEKKIHLSDIFFKENAYSLPNTYWTDEKWMISRYPDYRAANIDDYFDTSKPSKFNSLDACDQFAIPYVMRFYICDSNTYRYGDGNPILNHMAFLQKCIDGSILGKIRINVERRRSEDDPTKFIDELRIRIADRFIIRYQYSNNKFSNRPETYYTIYSCNHTQSNYRDIYYCTSEDYRSLFIKCNKPLFTPEAAKFFHCLEKIMRNNGMKYISKYAETYDADDPMTQYLDQTILKYAIVDNETVKEANNWLDSTKLKTYKFNMDTRYNIPACYLGYILPENNQNRQCYDRYGQDFKMVVKEKIPSWLTMNAPVMKICFDLWAFGMLANESMQHYNDRLRRTEHVTFQTIESMLDECNLRRVSYFNEIVTSYEKKLDHLKVSERSSDYDD